MAFKIKKRLTLSQRRERDSIQHRKSRRPQWLIAGAAIALLGYAVTQMARMGIFDSFLKLIVPQR